MQEQWNCYMARQEAWQFQGCTLMKKKTKKNPQKTHLTKGPKNLISAY